MISVMEAPLAELCWDSARAIAGDRKESALSETFRDHNLIG